ncbi:MAG TPA: phosphatidylglycerophosphatase A [Phycisphaerales bacterium]|nr:phosphatidylglycerophosphatase A [Phycisphaerales bacterium]HMP38337.1 phosphatidylglycerophosphatase A [Phycisphaerales bacterium]
MRLLLLTGLGLGRSPVAPGTAGSLLPVAVVLALVAIVGPHWSVDGSVALLGLCGALVCVRFGADGETAFGRKDPPQVVADEVAGQAIPLLGLPWRPFDSPSSIAHNALLAAVAFVAFRVFDIAKPPPIRRLQRLPGGFGILVDDLIAGLYALIAIRAALAFGVMEYSSAH